MSTGYLQLGTRIQPVISSNMMKWNDELRALAYLTNSLFTTLCKRFVDIFVDILVFMNFLLVLSYVTNLTGVKNVRICSGCYVKV